VARAAGGAPVLLHLRLEEVPAATDELVARLLLEGAEGRVVAVVVLLHDLEGPPALEHVAADQLPLDPVGELTVAGVAELVDALAEGQVGGAGEPVKRVEVPPGATSTASSASEILPRAWTVASSTPSGRWCAGEGWSVM